MKERPQSFRLMYGLTHLGLNLMVAHPFVSEVLITTVHKLMLLCTKGCTDTKGCATMRFKPGGSTHISNESSEVAFSFGVGPNPQHQKPEPRATIQSVHNSPNSCTTRAQL